MTAPNKTQAAILVNTGQPLQLMEVDIPPLKPGQVLVDVVFSGVCHSQLNEARGHKGPDKFLPHALGHEGAGRVLAVGPEVVKTKPGDHVVLSWLKGSGAEVPGTVYGSAIGPINSGAIATFMRQTVTCENRLTVIPTSMPLDLAALLGCAIPTGAGVVLNSSGLKPGESIAIFGVGGVGLSAVMGAASLGAGQIIAIDKVPEKLARAQELGATHVLDVADGDPVAAIRALTGGKGVRVAVECAGQVTAMEAAFESVMTGGGRCIVAGNPKAGQTMQVNPYSLIGGKHLSGTWGGESRPDDDVPRYIEMFNSGRLALDRLGMARYTLEQVNQALDDLEAGRIVRAMIDMQPGA